MKEKTENPTPSRCET